MIIEEEPLYADVTVVDDALDAHSTNPVQNKVITAALSNKASVGSTITNISINNPLNNQVLVFNGTNWVNGALTVSGGSSSPSTIPSLDDLTDVNISNPQDNQVLTYDNGSWVNSTVVSDGNGNSITVDGTVTENGENAVTSAGIYSFLAGKADIDHTHEISDVTGLSTALAGKSDTGHTHAYSSLTGAPSFTPDSALNLSSTNTVENGVVTAALNGKVSTTQLATASTPGLVKIGSGITVTNTGVISYAVGTDGGVVYDSGSHSLYINDDARRLRSNIGNNRVDLQTLPGYGVSPAIDTQFEPHRFVVANTAGIAEYVPGGINVADTYMWSKYFISHSHTNISKTFSTGYTFPSYFTSGEVGDGSVAIGGYCNCATGNSTIINGGYCYDQEGNSIFIGSHNCVSHYADVMLKCDDCYVVSGQENILLGSGNVRIDGSSNFLASTSGGINYQSSDSALSIDGDQNICIGGRAKITGSCSTMLNATGYINGEHSQILGGNGNSIDGDYSTILNGSNIHIYGDYCLALGGANYNVYQDGVTAMHYDTGSTANSNYIGHKEGTTNTQDSLLTLAEGAKLIVQYSMPYSAGMFVIENQEILSATIHYTQDSLDASWYQQNNQTVADTLPFYISNGELIADNSLRNYGSQDPVAIDFTIYGDAPLEEDEGDNE